jgi:hypothetical protein
MAQTSLFRITEISQRLIQGVFIDDKVVRAVSFMAF